MWNRLALDGSLSLSSEREGNLAAVLKPGRCARYIRSVRAACAHVPGPLSPRTHTHAQLARVTCVCVCVGRYIHKRRRKEERERESVLPPFSVSRSLSAARSYIYTYTHTHASCLLILFFIFSLFLSFFYSRRAARSCLEQLLLLLFLSPSSVLRRECGFFSAASSGEGFVNFL